MSRCECCQEYCLLVFPVKSVDPAAPTNYELLCNSCAVVVEQVRHDDAGLDVGVLIDAGVLEVAYAR
ncbi:MAG: hypothetical protein ACYDER_25595 [Ktedonobacteraceae bacterium]